MQASFVVGQLPLHESSSSHEAKSTNRPRRTLSQDYNEDPCMFLGRVYIITLNMVIVLD
jgi:hypothetical protein